MIEYEHSSAMTLADKVAKYYLEAYDELNTGKDYIMEAVDLRPTDKKAADRRVQMSADELGHAANIIDMVDSIVDDDVVMTLWNAMKNKLVGYMAWIKSLHAEYKENAKY